MTTERFDIYQRVTDRIVSAIEEGQANPKAWKMPWHGVTAGMPVNAVSGKPYRGVNVIVLWYAAQAAGYSSSRWATYKQWAAKGAQVRKGETATHIVYWKRLDDKVVGTTEDGDELVQRGKMMARGYAVFNAGQVDGYEEPPMPTLPEAERDAAADAFFAALGGKVKFGGNQAAYYPSRDTIKMPVFEAFRSAPAYYGTFGHEYVHWTGHKDRCNRDMSVRFKSEAYAMEELVAEIGSAFLSCILGVTPEPRPDHAHYVASWLKVLKGDKKAIFTAAARAQAAVDWMHAKAGSAVPAATEESEEEPLALAA